MTSKQKGKNHKTKGTSTPMDKLIGRQLYIARTLAEMSQEQLGEKADITFQQIQKYEKGINRISASRLSQFSKILNRPILFFYEPLENHADNNIPEAEQPTDQGKAYKAGKIICDIPDDAIRNDILSLARNITKHLIGSTLT